MGSCRGSMVEANGGHDRTTGTSPVWRVNIEYCQTSIQPVWQPSNIGSASTIELRQIYTQVCHYSTVSSFPLIMTVGRSINVVQIWDGKLFYYGYINAVKKREEPRTWHPDWLAARLGKYQVMDLCYQLPIDETNQHSWDEFINWCAKVNSTEGPIVKYIQVVAEPGWHSVWVDKAIEDETEDEMDLL